jgi:GNAT superfamily N-acetyltransferase
MARVRFRPYRSSDYEACLEIFDANCPTFFAPNERRAYTAFLDAVPEGYEVCEANGRTLGAFGLFEDGGDTKAINWILLAPDVQGTGIGSKVMERVIQTCISSDTRLVRIATSPKAAPFFARFGAMTRSTTPNGWGPDMDRVDMELSLPDG